MHICISAVGLGLRDFLSVLEHNDTDTHTDIPSLGAKKTSIKMIFYGFKRHMKSTVRSSQILINHLMGRNAREKEKKEIGETMTVMRVAGIKVALTR